MKKIICILFMILIIMPLFLACTDDAQVMKIAEQNKKKSEASSKRSLPIDAAIYKTSLTIESVEFYQDKSDHGYYLYAILTLDISELDGDDIYWMDKDNVLDFDLYITSEDNNYKQQSLTRLIYMDDEGKRYIFFTLTEEPRYSLENASYSMNFSVKHENSYERDYYYVINQNLSDGELLPTTDSLDKKMYNAFVEGQQSYLKRMKELLK